MSTRTAGPEGPPSAPVPAARPSKPRLNPLDPAPPGRRVRRGLAGRLGSRCGAAGHRLRAAHPRRSPSWPCSSASRCAPASSRSWAASRAASTRTSARSSSPTRGRSPRSGRPAFAALAITPPRSSPRRCRSRRGGMRARPRDRDSRGALLRRVPVPAASFPTLRARAAARLFMNIVRVMKDSATLAQRGVHPLLQYRTPQDAFLLDHDRTVTVGQFLGQGRFPRRLAARAHARDQRVRGTPCLHRRVRRGADARPGLAAAPGTTPGETGSACSRCTRTQPCWATAARPARHGST